MSESPLRVLAKGEKYATVCRIQPQKSLSPKTLKRIFYGGLSRRYLGLSCGAPPWLSPLWGRALCLPGLLCCRCRCRCRCALWCSPLSLSRCRARVPGPLCPLVPGSIWQCVAGRASSSCQPACLSPRCLGAGHLGFCHTRDRKRSSRSRSRDRKGSGKE